MLKILQVINTLGIGGAETLVSDLSIKMNSGNEVTIFVLGGKETFLNDKVKKSNVRVIQIGENIYSFKNLMWLIKNIKNYDIVHSHLSIAQYFVSIAKILNYKSNTKIYTTEHNTNNRRRGSIFLKLIESIMYYSYNAIIVINDDTKESLLKWQPKINNKIHVINNGIDLKKFKKAIPITRNENDKVVCMTAAFREAKDQDTVIKAMAYLPDEYKLWLVGDGVRRVKLEELTRELKLMNRITFMGFRDDVERIIKSADVFVLSSHWEGLPLSVIEAMAAQTPVIGSRVDGLIETINNAGVLFEHKNAEQLADCIVKIVTNNEQRDFYIKKGIKESKKYDVNLKIKEHLELYNI